VASTFAAVRDGGSGLGPITRFDLDGFETTFAAEVKGFDPTVVGRKEHRRMDRFTQFAIVASREAVAQSGLDIRADPTRVGVLLGTGLAGAETFESTVEILLTKGPRRISPFAVPMAIPNMAPGMVAIDIGAKGPNFAYSSAFAGSANAIGEAARMILDDVCDAAIAGGAEAPVSRMGVAGFSAMGALSTRNDDPIHAIRPFDLTRDGCVLGEAGAVLLLEDRDHALARGATILAELVGYGASADAFHLVALPPDGEGLVSAMRLAIEDAGIAPDQIGYLNAHGTATEMNDRVETVAIKRVFGDHAAKLPISSTKAATGHTLGAAGSLESIIAIEAMRCGMLPPTLNQIERDPICDLYYIPNVARSASVDYVMSNSMGFGGHNAVLIYANVDRAV
ncbi:MAG TPA: beta-ketoacyl-ACP synthase II, partial [Thermomicrobiales bacterium]|nr:beta-ketoacyl-ACP synthase II [Thermomicrobiales bacterium]